MSDRPVLPFRIAVSQAVRSVYRFICRFGQMSVVSMKQFYHCSLLSSRRHRKVRATVQRSYLTLEEETNVMRKLGRIIQRVVINENVVEEKEGRQSLD